MSIKNRRNAGLGLSLLFIIGAVTISFLLRPYESVDDYQIALVTNGSYSADGYCKYIHPIICCLIGLLHKMLPSADFYLIFIRLSYYYSIAVLAYYLPHDFKATKPIIPFLFFFLFFSAVNINYTVLTSFLLASGMCVFYIDSAPNRGRYINALILIGLGCLLRKQMLLLSLPFFMLETAFWKKETSLFSTPLFNKGNRKPFLALLTMISVLLIVSAVIEKTIPGYSEGIAYDNARTKIVDYPMQPYDSVKENIQDISENDYNSAIVLLLADTNRIDTAYLTRIGSLGSVKLQFNMQELKAAAKRFISCLLMDAKCPLIFAMTITMFVYAMLCDIKPVQKLKCTLSLCGGFIILYYFSLIGRIIDRLMISVFLLCVFSLAISIGGSEVISKKSKRTLPVLLLALYLIAACTAGYRILYFIHHNSMKTTYEEKIANAELHDEISKNDIYIWQVFDFDMNVAWPYMETGKLYGDEILDHHVVYGDWTYGQVYMKDYLSRLGIPNPATALLERPNTYYVGFDKTMIETYLKEHFDKDCHAAETGRTVYDVPVWSFQIE